MRAILRIQGNIRQIFTFIFKRLMTQKLENSIILINKVKKTIIIINHLQLLKNSQQMVRKNNKKRSLNM